MNIFDKLCSSKYGFLMIPITIFAIGAILIGLIEALKFVDLIVHE